MHLYAEESAEGISKVLRSKMELLHKTKRDREELRKSVLVDKNKFNIEPEIQVYDHKINIVSWREKLGIIIESEEIAEAMKQVFELCFDKSK